MDDGSDCEDGRGSEDVMIKVGRKYRIIIEHKSSYNSIFEGPSNSSQHRDQPGNRQRSQREIWTEINRRISQSSDQQSFQEKSGTCPGYPGDLEQSFLLLHHRNWAGHFSCKAGGYNRWWVDMHFHFDPLNVIEVLSSIYYR